MTDDEKAALAYREASQQVEERGLQEFLEFLCGGLDVDGRKIQLRVRDRDWEEVEPEHWGERIFADFFGVDLQAVERYRRKLLEEGDS